MSITAKTAAEYRSLAANFYKKRLGDDPPTPKRLSDELIRCAREYRPAYWRRLRGAIAFDQAERGYTKSAERVKATVNPTTGDSHGLYDKHDRACQMVGGGIVRPRRRVKTVKPADHSQLMWELLRRLDAAAGEPAAALAVKEVIAAVTLARRLGVRPAEMPGLSVDVESGVVRVRGAKKVPERVHRGVKSGARGADRVLRLRPEFAGEVEAAADLLAGCDAQLIHAIQTRLSRVTAELWPQRKARLTLYSYRHQLGSDLKASGASRRAIGYAMGHQSTKSADTYGDRRSGGKSSGGLSVEVGAVEDQAFAGRENHSLPPSAPAERTACGPEETPVTPVDQGVSSDLPPLPMPGGSDGPGM